MYACYRAVNPQLIQRFAHRLEHAAISGPASDRSGDRPRLVAERRRQQSKPLPPLSRTQLGDRSSARGDQCGVRPTVKSTEVSRV